MQALNAAQIFCKEYEDGHGTSTACLVSHWATQAKTHPYKALRTGESGETNEKIRMNVLLALESIKANHNHSHGNIITKLLSTVVIERAEGTEVMVVGRGTLFIDLKSPYIDSDDRNLNPIVARIITQEWPKVALRANRGFRSFCGGSNIPHFNCKIFSTLEPL